MKLFRLTTFALLFFTGCLFDNHDQVAGGEDFPNTITPLGKVAAMDISSDTGWDQFNDIDTTPNLSTDSLTASVSSTAKRALIAAAAVKDSTYTSIRVDKDTSIVQHVEVNGGPDSNVSTKSDNRIKEYDMLRSLAGDTLDWIRMTDADGDGALWGSGDSGTIQLQRQIKSPRPLVKRSWSTLKARIYHFGKTSTMLTYTQRTAWVNGDTTVLTVKGIRSSKDSVLIADDTSYVTYNRISTVSGSPVQSNARYWIHLGKLAKPFSDNALTHFEIVNRWNSGIIRYDSISFVPDSAVASGKHATRGMFLVSTQDLTGASGQLKGVLRGDSIQINMREIRNGLSKSYHLVYDKDGNVKTKDTLPDEDSILYPRQVDDDDVPSTLKLPRK